MNSFIRERLFYEIAMAIGNSLDLKQMLREGLSMYLRKLNCLAGAVLRSERDEFGRTSFSMVYAIPRRMNRNSAVHEAMKMLPGGLSQEALDAFLSDMPTHDENNGLNRYFMVLPGFGVLLLVKSAPGLSMPELKSLAPLNVKLAEACISCSANEMLQREIEERKRAEQKYKSIFNNAVEGIFQTTVDGRFTIVNPALARMLGYDTAEECMAAYSDLKRQVYVEPDLRRLLLERLMVEGQVTGFEGEFIRKDGSRIWISMSARLIRDTSGAPTMIEGTAENITPRMKAMAALREAKEEAEHLSQLKSSFLSMVSHELRTPLTSIFGFAKIIRKRMRDVTRRQTECDPAVTELFDKIGENVDVIITEGERLTELINNVLDLAKLEAGWFEWSDEDVDMNGVLNHSLMTTGVLFSEGNVRLEHDIAPNLSTIRGDKGRLIQVVINLVSNARKFTLEGTVTVTAVSDDEMVEVRVIDTGIGVPEDEAAVVFDKFRQLGNTLTDKPHGSGLGLSICKEIVDYHGGRLWYEPSEHGGSVFAFSLPIKRY